MFLRDFSVEDSFEMTDKPFCINYSLHLAQKASNEELKIIRKDYHENIYKQTPCSRIHYCCGDFSPFLRRSNYDDNDGRRYE